MKIRSTLNGGVAEVGSGDAERLIASGYWTAVTDEAKPARKPRSPRAAKSAPSEELESEE